MRTTIKCYVLCVVTMASSCASLYSDTITRTHDELSRVRTQTTGAVSEVITFDRATNITGIATTGGGVTIPLAPAPLAVTDLLANQATYTWPDVANETGYRLERRVEPGGTWTSFDLAANATSFPDQGLAPGTNYRLRLIAINSAGSSAPVEASFTTPDPSSPPSILTQPGIVAVSSGDSATLALSLGGSGPFTIEWFLGPVGNISNLLQSGFSDSLTLNAITQNKLLWARVSNAFGSTDTTAMQILLNSAPSIVIQPEGGAIATGSSLTLGVTANGTAPLSYQWYYGNPGDDSTPVPEATAATLNTGAQYGATTHWVRVTNPFGSANSTAADLTIISPPIISIAFTNPAADDTIVTNASLTVSGTASHLAESANFRLNHAGEWTQGALAQAPGVQPSFWFASVVLVPGLNTIEVYAKDAEGNESPVIERTIIYTADDHGDTFLDATALTSATTSISGILTAGDIDNFRVTVPGHGILIAWSESNIVTYGYLYNAAGAQVDEDNDSDLKSNFRVSAAVTAGNYYIRLKGNAANTVGTYTLRTRFIPSTEPIQVSFLEKANNDVNLGFTGIAGVTYYILGSDDLRTWTHITTLVGSGAENYAPLIGQGVQPKRYFRVSTAPPTSSVPEGFVLIPAGQFTMGDALDGDSNAVPHPVNLSAFIAQAKETTKAEWDDVRSWGLLHGYTDLSTGGGKAPNHPVQNVTWYSVLKWCNARSEKEGLAPCYFKDAAHTLVYQTGSSNLDNSMVSWASNGYRLPTEAEWEKAARGGLRGKRFSLGDTISHTQANYYSSAGYPFDVSSTRGYHPVFGTGTLPYTSPVGSFPANGYGLYDTDGNVWEWCWDGYGAYSSSLVTDPRGVFSTTSRIRRGSSCFDGAINFPVGHRMGSAPQNTNYDQGFRVARSY